MKNRSRKRKTDKNRGTAGNASLHGDIASWLRHDWVLGWLLLLTVIVVYQPVWHAGFIWDDDTHVTANLCIIGPLGLKEIWTTPAASICPLVLTTFWMEHALWGLQPLPYHLVNVLQHGACAILLWQILRSLQIPGAWLGAALWALHPLQVESVAWITEMKNTQSCLFYLLSILFFVKDLKAGRTDDPGRVGWNYALTLFFAALAMASKFSTAVLPAVLGLCAWWMEGRWRWCHLRKLGPIFLMSVVASTVTMWPQALGTETISDLQQARSWPERVITAGDVIWFYPAKLLWPHPLITIYPRWQIDAGQWISYLPLLAATMVFALLWLKRRSWSRPCFFAWSYFLVALSPFLGLIDQSFWRYSFVEDHLQYLADMGPLALAGAGIVWFSNFVLPGKAWLVSTLGAGLLLVLAILSWQQTWIYESQETLWSHTLAWNSQCWAGYNGLGHILLQKGQVDEAMVDYQRALEINPNYAEVRNNLGTALLQKGQPDEAIVQFRKALAIDPNYVTAHDNLGNALLLKGQMDEATAQFQKALDIDPNYVNAHNSLGNVLLHKGQVDEAIVQFQKALKIDPSFAQADYNLGNALLHKGQVDEAIIQFQKALEINPNLVEVPNNLGDALLQKGQLDGAIVQFQKALEINPNLVDTHNNLGNALLQKGQVDEAIIQFQKALEINPNYAKAHNNLGNALLQKGQVDEAIIQFQKALKIDPNYAKGHNNLGLALAQKGELGEAAAQFKEAVRLKPDYSNAQNNLAKVEAMARAKTPAK